MTINNLRIGRRSIVGCEYFVTFNTLNREPVFSCHKYARLLANEISNMKHVEVLSWVIMPDHVHMLFTL